MVKHPKSKSTQPSPSPDAPDCIKQHILYNTSISGVKFSCPTLYMKFAHLPDVAAWPCGADDRCPPRIPSSSSGDGSSGKTTTSSPASAAPLAPAAGRRESGRSGRQNCRRWRRGAAWRYLAGRRNNLSTAAAAAASLGATKVVVVPSPVRRPRSRESPANVDF